jgi:hypothetical protein
MGFPLDSLETEQRASVELLQCFLLFPIMKLGIGEAGFQEGGITLGMSWLR